MNKLEQIRFFLESNPNVKIVNINEIDRRNSPHMLLYTNMAHAVDFNIAPLRSLEINPHLAKDLESFMKGLILELEPDTKYDFEQEIITFKEREKEKQALILRMGYLDFYESFEGGLIQTTLQVDNKIHELSRKANYIRRIRINPFPNEEIADRYKYTSYMGHIRLNLNTDLSS